MSAFLHAVPALAGLALFAIGLFTALTRRRLDALGLGLFVAGLGVALTAAALARLGGAPAAGSLVARGVLALSLGQAVVFFALARRAAVRLRATRTDHLERLHG